MTPNKNEDMVGYIQRAVPDIARKCGCSQHLVWLAMYALSEDYYRKNKKV